VPVAVDHNTSSVFYLEDYCRQPAPLLARCSQQEWNVERDRMMRRFTDVARAHFARSRVIPDVNNAPLKHTSCNELSRPS
jgi:hypothetical protein